MTDNGIIVGIDLGTTYSLVSVLQNGKPIVLPNAVGEILTASAVSLGDDGTMLVGGAARARATTHPERTALAFKRDMGTTKVFALGDKGFSPQELSAMVLGALKRDAEAALGVTIREAVVTVPAYFGDLQRQATKDAGEIIGLKVERIINEPTAAAMAYGLHERGRELKAVVLDLGGGTFDVTVLEIMEGVIEIRASAGDAHLGGEDFDYALAETLAAAFKKAHGLDAQSDTRAWARLKDACEDAKKRLSSSATTRVAVPLLMNDVSFEHTLTRDDVEARWEPLLERMRGPIRRALLDAGLQAKDVDEVLLVGGSTRMPCVSRLAAQIFGRLPNVTLPPDEAIALGAAVQAGLKSHDTSVEDVIVTDVAPFSLGVSSASSLGGARMTGLFSPILERGTVIPASRSRMFATTAAAQNEVMVLVYQGEHSLCADNVKIGEYLVKDIPPGVHGPQDIEVRFSYDLNGILEVETTIVSTGKKATLVIERTPGQLTPEALAKAREDMARLKFHPRQALPNTTALARAEALYMELTGGPRAFLAEAMAIFRATLESQQGEAIDAARAQLVRVTNELRAANR